MTYAEKPASLRTPDGQTLQSRYGSLLELPNLSNEEQQKLLAVLWHCMVPFAELGYSLKPGDKFFEGAPIGMDDVLYSVLSPDAGASGKPNPKNYEEREAK